MELIAFILGVGAGELVGSVDNIDLMLGRAVRLFGSTTVRHKDGNPSPILHIELELDTRKIEQQLKIPA